MPTTLDAQDAIELDGHFAGWATSMPSAIDFEIVLAFGANMAAEFYGGVQAAISGDALPRTVAVVAVDLQHRPRSRLTFFGAVVSEIRFPALDAAARETAQFVLTAAANRVVYRRSSPSDVLPVRKTRPWLRSDFRLTIDGVDCTRVTTIDEIAVPVLAGKAGSPQLTLLVSEAGSDGIYAWYEQVVLNGEAGVSKSGTLEYLSADLRTALFRLHMTGLVITDLRPAPADPEREVVSRLRARVRCGAISLEVGPSPV